MCGIYGFANLAKTSSLNSQEYRAMITFLALQNQARGKDSTGLACIDYNEKVHDLRKAVKAKQYINTPQGKMFISSNINRSTKVCLGHTRFATQGAVNRQNAMPFIVDKTIIGTHNGHINNSDIVFAMLEKEAKTDVDSEAIFAGMSKYPDTEERVTFIDSLEGYASIAFYDKRKPKSMFFARYMNVLSLYLINDHLLVWSSDEAPIRGLKRILRGHKFKAIKFEEGEFLEVTAKKVNVSLLYNTPRYKPVTKNYAPTLTSQCHECRVWTTVQAYGSAFFCKTCFEDLTEAGWLDKLECDWCSRDVNVTHVKAFQSNLCDQCKQSFGTNDYDG